MSNWTDFGVKYEENKSSYSIPGLDVPVSSPKKKTVVEHPMRIFALIGVLILLVFVWIFVVFGTGNGFSNERLFQSRPAVERWYVLV